MVAMPWSLYNRPSAAIAAIKPYVESKVAGVVIDPWSEFAKIAADIDLMLYNSVSQRCYLLGESIYSTLYYPEMFKQGREKWVHYAEREYGALDASTLEVGDTVKNWGDAFDYLTNALRTHAEDVAQSLAAQQYDVAGFTVCFGQQFASLLVARELKKQAPETKVVFGGSSVSSSVARGVLNQFPEVDCVVRGEGELSLIHI